MKLEGSGLEIPLAVLKDVSSDISVNLFLASEIPPGTGLGSSASVCVGILKTLTTYLGQPISQYDLAERAFRITRDGLGTAYVGRQDEYACAFGGLNFISFERDGSTRVEPIKIESGVMQDLQRNLMLFFTGSSRHSGTILEEQEASTRAHTGAAVEALHEIRELADRMRVALEAGKSQRLWWSARRRLAGEKESFGQDLQFTNRPLLRVGSTVMVPQAERSLGRVVGDFFFCTVRPGCQRCGAQWSHGGMSVQEDGLRV